MLFDDDDPDALLFGEDLMWPPELDGTGDLKTVVGLDNLVEAAKTRAVAVLGEIPHRPDYGNKFDEFRNVPGSDSAHDVIQASLLAQYRRETRFESVDVDVTGDDSGDVHIDITGYTKTGLVVPASVTLEKTS